MGQSHPTLRNSLPSDSNISENNLQLLKAIYENQFAGDLIEDILDRLDNQEKGEGVPPEPNESTIGPSSIEILLSEEGYHEIELKQAEDYISLETIHPLLAISQVDTLFLGNTLTKKAWDGLSPALALATKFLTAPEARKNFWHRLAFGNPVEDPETGKTYLQPAALEQDFGAASAAFDNILEDFTQCLSFGFISQNNSASWAGVTHPDLFVGIGALHPDLAHNLYNKASPSGKEFLEAFRPRISLTSKYLCHLLSPESPIHKGNYPWTSANLRLQFTIAELVCHELCHAIWYSRTPAGVAYSSEPYVFLSDGIPEAGLSFDFFLAGGLLDAGITEDKIGAMISTSWEFPFNRPGIGAMVDMQWIERWFLRETWARDPRYRETELWGSAPSTAGKKLPKYFMADRLLQSGEYLESPSYVDVLYKDRVAVATCVDAEDPASFSGPEEGVSLEEWYTKVRDTELASAREKGYDESLLISSWGPYEFLKEEKGGTEEQEDIEGREDEE